MHPPGSTTLQVGRLIEVSFQSVGCICQVDFKHILLTPTTGKSYGDIKFKLKLLEQPLMSLNKSW